MKLSFHAIVTRLFKHTSVVLVGGDWKTGKTNFALHLGEKCLTYGLVSEVATNIETTGQNKFITITDTQTMKDWLSSNGHLKLFIFDEGNEHLPNTGFMTKKSTDIKSIIPQISKKRARLIVIAQDLDSIDKTFRKREWWRGTFQKLSRTDVKFTGRWNMHKPIVIHNVKPTQIQYDPYVSAEFKERPEVVHFFKDSDRQILSAWAIEGKTCKQMGIHNQTLNRLSKAYVKRWLEQDTKEAPKEEAIAQ